MIDPPADRLRGPRWRIACWQSLAGEDIHDRRGNARIGRNTRGDWWKKNAFVDDKSASRWARRPAAAGWRSASCSKDWILKRGCDSRREPPIRLKPSDG